ncbi:MAG: DUF4870 domain-containing protein [Verrucomicrobia bacterium]|nr:DUF4870 domain-containing protein [Verrucomicrobiota bacterium]MCF7707594.1 DUF4870 domain-containing protein [Verrucomicrobiota bacterium]
MSEDEQQYKDIPPAPERPDNQALLWATFCHLSALAVFIGIPLGNVIGPLVIWLIKRNEMPIVDEHGKAALNFQISMSIYFIVSLVLALAVIGFFLLLAWMIMEIVFVIIAAVKANNGESYEYPLTIQFLK